MWVGGGITGMGEIPMLGVKEKGIAKVIRDIFRNGEQGFFYDPSDLGSMYQVALGTTELKSTGQPTGLMLDKSMGLALGPELFDDSKVILQGAVRLESGLYRIKTEGPLVFFRPYSDYSGNKRLRIEYEITESVEGTIRSDVTLGGSNGVAVRTALGKYVMHIYGTSLAFTRETAPTDVTIRILSVKEVLGNHAYQTTSASRPILQQTPILGTELLSNGDFNNGGTGWTTTSGGWAFEGGAASPDGLTSNRSLFPSPTVTSMGKAYKISMVVRSKGTQGSLWVSFSDGAGISNRWQFKDMENGSVLTHSGTISGNPQLYIKTTDGWDGSIESVSIKEIIGYRTDQNRIEYDGVDDKLITNLPTPLTNATVLRAIPNVGTQVKYNQTLPMLYEDSTNHSGLIAIDRALTRKEQLRLMDELDKRAGATSLDTLTFKTFDNNQEGFVFDPNDLSTMYQDAAGTNPVTAAGQPVGLMLDKSKGLVLGAERLKNGDFNAGGANWNVIGADGTHIATFADGKLRYQSDTISPVLAISQSGALVTGKWYEVTINCSNYVSGSLKIDAGNGGILVASGLGTFTTKILAVSTLLTMVRNSANVDLTIDSISVKEILGNHAYQTTSASRPILRQNAVTGANYLEFDGSDDFLQTSNIDFTATDKVSLFAGLNELSASIQVIVELGPDTTPTQGSYLLSLEGGKYAFKSRGTVNMATVQSARSSTVSVPDLSVVSAKGDISGDSNTIKRNGASGASSTVDLGLGNYGNHPLYIGRRAGTSLPFNGHIYGLIGIGKLASDDESVTIEKEFAKRLGVTLNV